MFIRPESDIFMVLNLKLENMLKNKTALVTGGNRGIGRAVSEYFMRQGASVAVHYNRGSESAESLVKLYGDQVSVFQADFSVTDEVMILFEKVIKKMGRIDVLVNNAGIAENSDPFSDDAAWMESWMKTMNINLNSAALLCKKTINEWIKEKRSGRIINIASRAAFRGDTAEYMAYAASKGGLVALTRSIARAFGKKNIVAFTIAPGFVHTDMAQQFFDQYGENYGIHDIALNDLTKPEDVAPLIGFLASGSADHATGGTFDINAGSYVH